MEAYASDMVQRSNHAVMKDARTMSFREEFALDTVLKSKVARWSLQKTLCWYNSGGRVCASDIRACSLETHVRNSVVW